ncbi:immunity 49 family protein [Streptomyces hirsutus]|uniref:Immunity 49 family protein n=1 Tax=Streptomyces hirsutus TaxID=35620 RepID=A0ABZ1GY28_9ACTN|nr:Imm49 family immunity protein [Streptomyces hirsutus]WSD11131.1 immunity 49 family protein [Streptomyces hirsutus]WTD15516.1 immunity 49 family protein [Streptomyces hirsutus]
MRLSSSNAAGTLTPDQRLLRVLLDDVPAASEQALQERLVAHRESAEPAARSLLPVGAVTLAALARLAHGWQLGIRSAYLPEKLVSAPQQKRPAVRADPGLGAVRSPQSQTSRPFHRPHPLPCRRLSGGAPPRKPCASTARGTRRRALLADASLSRCF